MVLHKGLYLLSSLLAFTMLIPCASYSQIKSENNAASLRLIPYPKKIEIKDGLFNVSDNMVIAIGAKAPVNGPVGSLKKELQNSRNISCQVNNIAGQDEFTLALSLPNKRKSLISAIQIPKETESENEGYIIDVSQNGVVLKSKSRGGYFNGIQTLTQLIRANMQETKLQCMQIIDWPSMEYRGYSHDITRGPNPTLDMLKFEIELTSYLRMNFFTYYLEHQYEFSKHPLICPKDGSLKPDELTKLIRIAESYGIEVIGCQQSFGHFAEILKHEQYKHLQENLSVLNPLNEGAYQLLDDLYSEQAPLIKSKFFNVCCDETEGLGEGATKEAAEKIGVGKIYTNHIKRIHDILKNKYQKRMMMWGDIILNHPENLNDIPKDTVMLSWGYEALPSFNFAIKPFKDAGFDFFVCPGVNNWSRILPDFNKAVINIQNYVRDGAEQDAMGMLNTTWADDGEPLFHYNWYGLAWGSECAWNASKTDIKDFNRRIGAVLFGEDSDDFGNAVELLQKAHGLPSYNKMMNYRFWIMDNASVSTSIENERIQAKALIDITEAAIMHLNKVKQSAKTNLDILDSFIFGAERMNLMAKRQIAFFDTAKIYSSAYQSQSDKDKAKILVDSNINAMEKIRDAHKDLKDRYIILWNRENRPFALDRVSARYDNLINEYQKIIDNLKNASASLKSEGTLPSPVEVGLAIQERGIRSAKALPITAESLNLSDVSWTDETFSKRIGIVVEGDDKARINQPIEIDLPFDTSIPKYYRLYEQVGDKQILIDHQISAANRNNRLIFIADGSIEANSKRIFLLYYMPAAPIIEFDKSNGMHVNIESNDKIWIENNKLKLLIGAEGGHIYRWEVKSHNNLDLTIPGETGWFGFADNYEPHRHLHNNLEVLENGNILIRVKCTDQTGMEKTISLWKDASWAEVTYNSSINTFACYDDINLMGADSKNPGTAIFSDGYTEKIRPYASYRSSQVIRDDVLWSGKYSDIGILLALITPELPMRHIVGPGDGMGGVVIEEGKNNAHFVIYGDNTPENIKETLNEISVTLDYTHQPKVYLTESVNND